jgi:putative redox protein
MADETERRVVVERVGEHLYRATNVRGGTLTFGSSDGPAFTPIELLLTAIGGCTAMDVEYITEKRAQPLTLTVATRGDKIRDDAGNRMTNLELVLHAEFPDDEAGDAARAVLPDALRKSHDRLCTVSRTIEVGTTVTVRAD